jgi:hypothetical protein
MPVIQGKNSLSGGGYHPSRDKDDNAKRKIKQAAGWLMIGEYYFEVIRMSNRFCVCAHQSLISTCGSLSVPLQVTSFEPLPGVQNAGQGAVDEAYSFKCLSCFPFFFLIPFPHSHSHFWRPQWGYSVKGCLKTRASSRARAWALDNWHSEMLERLRNFCKRLGQLPLSLL